jgi:alpha-tubulin suppressor-like RCC1 family protein
MTHVARRATFEAIAAGPRHTCGLTSRGVAYCWGNNWEGQLGDGTRTGRTGPVPVLGDLVFKTITVGGTHTCGLTTDGAAYCWGNNRFGQLGDGTERNRTSPVSVLGGLRFKTLSAGRAHTCGLTAWNDRVTDTMRPGGLAYCWGANDVGQLGDDTASNRASPAAVVRSRIFNTLSAGGDHACGIEEQVRREPSGSAIVTGGPAYCWGGNWLGQLGDGTTTNPTQPVAVAGGLVFQAISAGTSHTCGLTTEGAAFCWGADGYGATSARLTNPAAVAGGLAFRAISAGEDHACALTTAGAAYCWGSNANGELGDGTTISHFGPVAVSGGLVFQAISASPRDPDKSPSGSHTCALTAGGAVFCWGYNDNGELGDGTTNGRSAPVAAQPPPDTPPRTAQIDAGSVQRRRDLSTPATRLVGHWTSPSDGLEFYFGPIDATTGTGALTQVVAGQGGEVARLRYSIVARDPAGEADEVELRIEGGGAVGRINRLAVAREGQTLTWFLVMGDIGRERDLRYVDARIAPR